MNLELSNVELSSLLETIEFIEFSFDDYRENENTYYAFEGKASCNKTLMDSLLSIKDKINKLL